MKLFLVIVTLLPSFLPGHADKSLRFQKDSAPTTNSTAVIFLGSGSSKLEEVSSFSFSLWFKVDYFRPSTYVFSYSTSNSKSNQLNLRFDESAVFLVLAGVVMKISSTNFYPDQWYSMVAVLSENPQNLKFYINRELVLDRNIRDKRIPFNGTVVLGQETDFHNGGFVDMQSFCGWISHFNIYKRVLTLDEVETISNSTTAGDLQGDIVSWKEANWQLNGIVEEEEVEIRSHNQAQFTLIAEQLTVESSRTICMKLFRSPIYIPRNSEENVMLYNKTKSFPLRCKSPNHNLGYLWLGATDEMENGSWKTFEGKKLNWTNFVMAGTSKIQECSAFLYGNNPGKWDDVSCAPRVKLCPVCEIDHSTRFTLRGLCEDDPIHWMFMPSKEIKEKLSFKGFTRFNIQYSATQQSWFLTDIWKDKNVAKLFVPDLSYPLGTREWEIIENYEICNLPKGAHTSLSFTNCVSGEFNCRDGSCIPMEKRCDLRTDCADNSDEEHCDILIKSDHYMRNLFPPGRDASPLKTNLTVIISRISDVDVRAMKIILDLTVSVSWFDRRLDFKNLSPITDLNIVPDDDLWKPSIEYVNADFNEISSSSAVVTANRLSTPMEENMDRYRSDLIYEGDKNPLTISWKISAPFSCDMHLYEFPFDHQKCNVDLKLESSRAEWIAWDHVIAGYNGPAKITEYEVGPVETSVHNNSFGFSVVSMSIVLSRRYSYYITTTFIPTFLLVIISYMSFFVKLEHVDLRVMMTITTLLVLYSLYQQIEGNLPKTSYVKAIDIWCFFALIMIMTMVIYHILLGVDMKEDPRERKSTLANVVSKSNLYQIEVDPLARQKRLLRFAQISYIIVFILFLVGYGFFIHYDLYSVLY